jgi:hypothetical protein
MAYSEGGYESDVSSTTDASGNPSPSSLEPMTHADSGSDRGRSSWHDDSRSGYSSHDDWDDRYRRSYSSWSLWGFIRRLFGMGDDVQTAPGRLTPDDLARLAREGHDLHPSYCHQSVAHVTDRLGIAGLGGKPADQQVAYMRQNWSTIDARAAQDRANQGGLVIAGLADAGMAHTAIVTPGSGSTKMEGTFYPNVTCGGPPNARSDGSRTAGDVWSPLSRDNVEYFVAQ